MKIWEFLKKNKSSVLKKDFATKIGVSDKTLCQIQNGSDMKLTTAFKIVNACNGEVTFQDLYEGISEKD